MTKEELKQEAKEYQFDRLDPKAIDSISEIANADTEDLIVSAYLKGAEPREERIAELEEKISVLLSCKNCSENKGGYICEKEYENKCLAQKIQFIKELQEEIADLKKRNSELAGQKASLERWLGESKKLIEDIYDLIPASHSE